MGTSLAVVFATRCCTTVATELAAESNSRLCSLCLYTAAVQAGSLASLLRVSTGYTTYWLGVLFVQSFCLVIHLETASCSWQNSMPSDYWFRKHLYCFSLCCVIFPIRLLTNSWSFWLCIQSISITGMCYWLYLSSVPHAAKSSFPSPAQITWLLYLQSQQVCKVQSFIGCNLLPGKAWYHLFHLLLFLSNLSLCAFQEEFG